MNPYAATFQGSVSTTTGEGGKYRDGDDQAASGRHEQWDGTQQEHDAGREVRGDDQYWDYAAGYNQAHPVGYGSGFHHQVKFCSASQR